MNYDQQINRMVESGILSPEQSDKLSKSLVKEPHLEDGNKTPDDAKKKFPFALALSTVCLVILLTFFIINGQHPSSTAIVEDVTQTLNQSGGHGAMNSLTSGVFAIAIFLIIPILMFVFIYNGLVSKEEEVRQSWAQVESNYQRRADLIPNLIETVSKYLTHESTTLSQVTGARNGKLDDIVEALVTAQGEGAKILGEAGGDAPVDESYITNLDTTQQRVGGIMHRLLATVEAYPELRSSEQMMELQAQLEGTENRINVARLNFNETVGTFNKAIRTLPGSVIAGIGNFQRKAYFTSSTSASQAIDAKFD